MISVQSLIITLVIGAVAGWLASLLMGKKKGLIANIILGIIGSFVGTWLLGVLGISIGVDGILGSIIVSTIGACIFIAVLNLLF